MATLKRVYKGGKKVAEKKSKDTLVNALYKVYNKKSKVSGVKRKTVTRSRVKKTVGKTISRVKKNINFKKGDWYFSLTPSMEALYIRHKGHEYYIDDSTNEQIIEKRAIWGL